MNRLFKLLILITALSIIADFIYVQTHQKHFPWEVPAFHALFGFVVCILLIVISKAIGHKWLMKDEDYYERWYK